MEDAAVSGGRSLTTEDKMHEVGICQGIVEAAVAEMESRKGARLLRTHVVVGKLHQIVPDMLCSAYDALTRDTVVGGSELVVRQVPVAIRCRDCGWQGEIEGRFFHCGTCGGGAVDIERGKELFLERLEVEDAER